MQATQTAYLTLAEAQKLIDEAIREAANHGDVAAVTIVDAGGWRLAEARADDAPLAALEEARMGAQDVATGEDSLSDEEQSNSRPVIKGGRVVAGMGVGLCKLDSQADAPPPLSL